MQFFCQIGRKNLIFYSLVWLLEANTIVPNYKMHPEIWQSKLKQPPEIKGFDQCYLSLAHNFEPNYIPENIGTWKMEAKAPTQSN